MGIERWSKMKEIGAARAILMAIAFLAPSAAFAHKVNLSANVEGATIRGKVHFRGMTPAQGVAVVALDPAGAELAKATTDEQGAFAFAAQYRCDYRLVADAGEGHGAEYVIQAAQLPAELPPRGDGSSPTTPVAPNDAPAAVSAGTTATGPAPPGKSQLDAVRADIARLHEELRAYEDRTRLRDLLGGVGYILGVAGIAFYLLACRRGELKPP